MKSNSLLLLFLNDSIVIKSTIERSPTLYFAYFVTSIVWSRVTAEVVAFIKNTYI